MIRHVVMFKWKTDSAQDDQEKWLTMVRALPEKVKFIRSLSVGRDQLRLPHSYSVALVADFDNLDDVKRYAVHPAHIPVAEMSRKISEHICAVDFEL